MKLSIYLVLYSLSHQFTPLLTNSLTHILTSSLSYSFTRSHIYLLTYLHRSYYDYKHNLFFLFLSYVFDFTALCLARLDTVLHLKQPRVGQRIFLAFPLCSSSSAQITNNHIILYTKFQVAIPYLLLHNHNKYFQFSSHHTSLELVVF